MWIHMSPEITFSDEIYEQSDALNVQCGYWESNLNTALV